ncbi:NAD-dependent epimerase/dehydratase family protein [Azospirillum griseum]|uniref:NAD(P)-dependent oxidoreductase n=1 Tax=Azospirillum griseum TaxID=2496639 RepID=A0A3S0K7Q4_9PROT|nr:NAD(P)-dependent oxidoreductase [Azospirillum griseum]RTR15546.1 NAD(P)-dependent oxidoreductase [Azospirillum griseum]
MLTHHFADPADPARVVVLGARGFVGGTLVAALENVGIPVLALGSADLDLAAEGAGSALAGRLQPEDSLVFLSALTPDKGRGIASYLANQRMGAAVAEAVERVTPAHLVYLSSDAVYPMTAGLVNEESPADCTDLYGVMHRARELMMAASCRAPLAVLRPTLIYGAADTHNSYGPNRLRRAARKDGRITLFGEGEETRDHILVDDAVALILRVLRHRSAGLLNLATGRSVSYRDLADKVAALFDTPVEVVGTSRQNPVTHRHFDVTALLRAFPGFAFTPLDEGLAKAHREMMAGA